MQNPIERGVIAKVRGEEMSAAQRLLPVAARGQPQQITCEIDTLLAGRVRISFELQRYSHGRNQFWHWVGRGAEQLELPAG
ncbi:hypothetical protein [Delftia tsuruhatensis]|uniref:Uncharacterized protein n=1 Tax=Delftia tsuruhatensis TaxID=180282 RepID=A0ABN4SFA0_9BURK|nr:hypothetical protein [Delftia tsuruhatensis]AOV00579.1 hypothetical protein BI380_04025 [Delftia tsuruhatensis]